MAGAKTVLVGDAHQLAPVKARGGMFAQLCADLPWTQRLSEVWRMRDSDERAASLAVRDGGPAPVRRAVGWYRSHDRLHTGDPIAMAPDALQAYRADVAAGKDALLVCDTREMCDALNRRIHDETVSRGRAHRDRRPRAAHRRRRSGHQPPQRPHPRRLRRHRHQTRRLIRCATATAGESSPSTPRPTASPPNASATAPASCSTATTCASTSPSVMRSPCTPRRASPPTARTPCSARTPAAPLLYVAMTRGRDANTAYLYERAAEHEYAPDEPEDVHIMRRGSSRHAGQLMRSVIATHDEPITAHDIAAQASADQLPDIVRHLLDRRATTVNRRHLDYQAAWCTATLRYWREMELAQERHISRSQDIDYGIEL